MDNKVTYEIGSIKYEGTITFGNDFFFNVNVQFIDFLGSELPEDYVFLQVNDEGLVSTRLVVDREDPAFGESSYFEVL